ncbi:DUF305 domain-containing protein [Acrocarpospora catenulata]|uniref:DUF305 domain-containing protein n=1 Tax=Acrocarpospora catenulata TaxID=2836182 RepID=UPI001BD97EB8|nr:DUF305 domain-containing protein [Acrocarpospora catenulata]
MTSFSRMAVPALAAMALLAACSEATPEASPTTSAPAVSSAAPTPTPDAPSPTPSPVPESPTPDAVITPEKGYNEADIQFAASMIPHHLQAFDLTQLAATRAGDQWVRDLASRIYGQLDPEVRTLKNWLDEWGAEPLPRDHKLPGGVSRADLEKLAATSGPAFDRRFLTLMIDHHEGALTLAKAEQAEGASAAAKAMAGGIVTSQEAEIKEMKKYLARLK